MMKTLLVSLAALSATSLLFPWPGREPEVARAAPGAADAATVPIAPPKGAAQAPAFVPNQGQWHHGARFAARLGAMGVFLDPGGWTLTLEEPDQAGADRARWSEADGTGPKPTGVRGVAVRMSFAGADRARLVPERPRPGVHHYLLGDDPAAWRTDVPRYASVRYEGVRPGVDVRMREHGGHFEYDLLLEPDARLDDVAIDVRGIEGLHVDGEGALILETALGPVRMPLPVSWEEAADGTDPRHRLQLRRARPRPLRLHGALARAGLGAGRRPGPGLGHLLRRQRHDTVTQVGVGPTGEHTIAGGPNRTTCR